MSPTNSSIIAAAIGLLPVTSFGQVDPLEFATKQSSTFFGRHACLTIDLDGDGVRDVVSGAAFGGSDRRGALVFLSGKDLSLLRVVPAPGPTAGFGMAVRGDCGDFDADGSEDLIVEHWHGAAMAYSPSRSRVITRFADGRELLGPVGDLDGDGADDVALGSSRWGAGGQWIVDEHVFSGRTGARLVELDAPRTTLVSYRADLLGHCANRLQEQVGPWTLTQRRSSADGLNFFQLQGSEKDPKRRLAFALADFDGDRRLDVLRSHWDWSPPGGRVSVFTPAQLEPRTIAPEIPGQSSFAYRAIAVPDIDGDGISEFAVSDPDGLGSYVQVHSGATAKQLRGWGRPDAGVTLELVPDTDSDGIPDLLIGGGDWMLQRWVTRPDGFLCIVSTRTAQTLVSIEEAAVAQALGMPPQKR